MDASEAKEGSDAEIGQAASRGRLLRLMRFRSFRGRILFFFLGLITLVQASVFLAVDLANALNARHMIDEALEVTARQFQRLIESRSHELTVAARLLSGDFAFKRAFATGEHGTILSALGNHRRRISADALILTSVDGGVIIADTLHPEASGGPSPFATLVEVAMESDSGEVSGMVVIDGTPYHMVLVPLLAPVPVAWIAVGFLIDDGFAEELETLTRSHVTLLSTDRRTGWTDHASTLPAAPRGALPDLIESGDWALDHSVTLTMNGAEYVTLITELEHRGGVSLNAVLQRSQAEALAPYFRVRMTLLALTFGALLFSLYFGTFIARSVSKPVQALLGFTESVEKGDYSRTVRIDQEDELGKLARSFNRMVEGLKEREFIRDTFGKYVPESVANAILRDRGALAPQSRTATVLFTDIQDFTTIAETMTPEALVTLLNEYFSAVVEVIDSFGGVVNQFQGDAMLVTYNLPVADPDHAANAVRTALEIERRLSDHAFGGDIRLVTRIGINTGNVVAGAVGAGDRLTYTVHGDAVNLAARLEGLNKELGTRILVSQAVRRLAGNGFAWKSMGEIAIRGKTSRVTVYSPETGDPG